MPDFLLTVLHFEYIISLNFCVEFLALLSVTVYVFLCIVFMNYVNATLYKPLKEFFDIVQ